MGRKLWFVGLVATVLFLVASLTGYPVEGKSAVLRLHLLVSLGAGLLVFFCHAALALYVGLTGRLLGKAFREGGLEELRGAWEDVRRRSRLVLPLAGLALSGGIASVVAGGETYAGNLASPLHHALAWGALVTQGAALAAEWPLLGRHERLIRAVDGQLAEAG